METTFRLLGRWYRGWEEKAPRPMEFCYVSLYVATSNQCVKRTCRVSSQTLNETLIHARYSCRRRPSSADENFSYYYLFIYYESTKRKLKTKYICECHCYERLQTKTKEFTRLSYTELVLELQHLKMWVWVLDAIGAPSRLRVTRKSADLLLFIINRESES
jgi:hypothetical protein